MLEAKSIKLCIVYTHQSFLRWLESKPASKWLRNGIHLAEACRLRTMLLFAWYVSFILPAILAKLADPLRNP